MRTELKIQGMMCGGCENAVRTKLSQVNEVENVEVDHTTGTAVINSSSELDRDELVRAVEQSGYKVL